MGLMFNRNTYYIIAIVMILSVPKAALSYGFAVPNEQQIDVNQDVSLEALLDRIYAVNRTDIKEAERLSHIAFAQLQKKPDKNLRSRLLNLVGYRKTISLQLEDALKNVLEARRLAVEVKNKKEEATSYRVEGLIYTFFGDSSQGISLFFRALELQKQLPDNLTYDTLQNIGIAYYVLGDYDNYLKHGYMLLEHPTAVTGSVAQAIAYGIIGSALTELGDFDKARGMLAKAEVIFIDQNVNQLFSAHIVLADIEYRTRNYKQALNILTKSMRLAKKRSYEVTLTDSLTLRAKIETAMGDSQRALKTLDELSGFAKINKFRRVEQEVYRQRALIYEGQGKYQQALKSHQKFKEITDELFNDRSATKIALAQTRYEMEQKEQTIALLEAEAALDVAQHTQLEKETTLRGYIIVLVILMLFGAGLVVFRIIRTRRVLEKKSEDLKEAYRQAEDANSSKSTFLASMSHDLRTPLNAILGYSEAIQLEIKGPLNNDSYKDYISSINRSGKLLLDLIDDVLDLSKIEAGKYELVESEISLHDVITRVLEMIAPIAESKEIGFECDCPDNLALLFADERILVQILNNLISNSLKFTDINEKISIKCVQGADGGLNISIADNGIGMTEADLVKAMRPFEQIDPEVTQGNGGTGLGLALCIKYMELHDGRLEMTSEKGVGTTVTLHFPASRAVT